MIVLFDVISRQLGNGSIVQDRVLGLIERTSNSSIISVKNRGVWFLVDNSHLNWGATMPPMKSETCTSETRWSEWLEPMG